MLFFNGDAPLAEWKLKSSFNPKTKTQYTTAMRKKFSPIDINGTGLIEEDDPKTGVLLLDMLLDGDGNSIIGRVLLILKHKL
jgi:hypothetical protein